MTPAEVRSVVAESELTSIETELVVGDVGAAAFDDPSLPLQATVSNAMLTAALSLIRMFIRVLFVC